MKNSFKIFQLIRNVNLLKEGEKIEIVITNEINEKMVIDRIMKTLKKEDK